MKWPMYHKYSFLFYIIIPQQNQNAVEDEIRTLISDNQKLSHQVGMLLKERLNNARQTNGKDEDVSKELEELTKQLSLLTKVLLQHILSALSSATSQSSAGLQKPLELHATCTLNPGAGLKYCLRFAIWKTEYGYVPTRSFGDLVKGKRKPLYTGSTDY